MRQPLVTNDDELWLEERRESIYISDLSDNVHIVAYKENGPLEISKSFMRKIVLFFDDRENRKFLEMGYDH